MVRVEICNLRNRRPTEAWHIIVDRTSRFGNPFVMTKVQTRDAVCDGFEEYMKGLLSKGDKRFEPLLELANKYGKVSLFCWCAPKRCHAETLKKYIESGGGQCPI